MNLVLDFGNTRIKAGVFKGNELLECQIFDGPDQLLASALLSFPFSHCLIASVTRAHESLFEELAARFDTRLFTAASPVPLRNLYRSALTLGSDRLAAAVGSFTLFPSQNVLTVDAGTCIKYNFVNAANEYLGGAISPGLAMRLKAMHQFTSALPEVKIDPAFSNFLGTNTSESLSSGALIGSACEIDGMIERYRQTYQHLQVVLTGGDAPYLSTQLKSRFFASQNILLLGLNAILNLSLEK